MMKAIVNANVVTPYGILFDGAIVIEDKCIVDIKADRGELPEGTEIIDAEGAYVGPGFVDIHVHGRGHLATYDASAKIVNEFLKHGTTSFLTTPYYVQNLEEILKAIEDTKEAMKKSRVIKGIYMEGPFTNPNYGANADLNPWRHGIVEEEYKAIVDAGGELIKVWTTAPELDGIEEFMAYAKKVNPNTVIALGHSEATPQLISSLNSKFQPKLMTHMFDATGRIPVPGGTRGYGPDEYCLATPDMYAEVISDSCGLHMNGALQRMVLQNKGVDKVVLVTDSTKTDSPSPEELAYITDINFDHNGNINGSVLTMDMACRNIMSHTSCGIAQAFIMASLNPAKVIGMDDEIGSIEKGKIADLVFVDDKFNVLKVMTEGEFYE